MNLELEDQVAVVVGAASGIGQATAAMFAAEGAKVCWLDKSPTVHESAKAGKADRTLAMEVDATDFDSVTQIADLVHQQFGRCDHVVVSIGVGSGKLGFPFWRLHPSDWARVLDVNLTAPVAVAHAFTPHMIKRQQGTLTFISSVAGQIGSQTDPPYSAAKAGLINFTQCAAKDLAEYNIRVNAIAPGMVKTSLNRDVWQMWRDASPDNQLDYEAWGQDKVSRLAPLARWQEPEQIAASIVFLASHWACNITGQTLNVDGGQVMR